MRKTSSLAALAILLSGVGSLLQAQQDVTTLSVKKGVILSNTLEAKSQSLVDALSSASLDEL